MSRRAMPEPVTTPDAAPEPVLAARGLVKRFADKTGPGVTALDQVSLEVSPATLTAFVGPDGAGKTTLLRLAAGLMRADAGELRVLGIDVATDPQTVQDRISYMPQRFGLYEDLSVQENLDLYADLHGVTGQHRRERFERLLHMTDLGRFVDRPAGKLSGGMKQKLGLACTLVRSPDLLLLDEPTVGVDPLSRRELWQIVRQLIDEERLSVVVSTAYMDEAEQCEQVVMMVDGKVLADGGPAPLREHAQGRCFVATPASGTPARALQASLIDHPALVADAVPVGGQVRLIRAPDSDEQAWQSLVASLALQAVPPRLEDGFMLQLHARTRGHSQAESAAVAGVSTVDSGQDDDVAIDVHDLVRRFGDFTAVANTTFAVRRGEIFGLLGPNGAGKTTTFRMLCGLLPASGGTLRVAGVDLRIARNEARRHIGYVAQKFALYGNLSVRENLDFFGGVYGLKRDERRRRIGEVLDAFDLAKQASHAAGMLPGGFKQRLAMAAALLHEPSILFLDEPTSGIDPLARRAFWRRITALAEQGVTVVVTTHFMEEAEYCDRILIQDAGQVLAVGSPGEIREQMQAASMDEAFIRIVEQARANTGAQQVAA